MSQTLEPPSNVEVSDEQVDHYANPNEEFYLHVLLENDESYEIMSISIDNIKYQSYQFQDNSTSEEIIIKMQAPSTPGPYTYRITGIKYVYESSILDVDLDNTTPVIKLGVTDTARPQIVFKELSTDSGILIVDYLIDDQLYLNATYRFILFLDGEIVDYLDTNELRSTLYFDELEVGKVYQFAVICYADFFDGNGVSSYLMYEEEIRAYSEVSLVNFVTYPTYITYEIKEDNVVTNLMVSCNGQDVTNTSVVSNLVPNTEYTFILSYVTSSTNELVEIKYVLITPSYEEPSLLYFNVDVNKTSISYQVNILDVDSIVSNFNVSLYDAKGTLIETKVDLEGTFNSLLSDTIYEIRLSYDYKLDETEIKNYSENKYVSTLAKTKPIVSPIFRTGSNEIYCYYDIYDPDNTILEIDIFYEDSGSYATYLEDDDFTFKNLEPNKTYNIFYVVYYQDNSSFDLTREVYKYEVDTISATFQLVSNIDEIFTTSCRLRCYFKQSNNSAIINSIELYGPNDTLIKVYQSDEIGVEYNYYTLYFEDLTPNTQYFYVINYSYNNYDGQGYQEYNYNNSFKTAPEIKAPDITYFMTEEGFKVLLSLTNTEASNASIKYVYINNEQIEFEQIGNSLNFLIKNEVPTNFELSFFLEFRIDNIDYLSQFYYDIKIVE